VLRTGHRQEKGGTTIRAALTVFVVVVFLFGGVGAACAGGTQAEAKALAEQAAEFLNANGKEKTLAELNKPKGRFDKGEMYVYALDMQGTVLAHVKSPALVGKNTYKVPDEDGKLFRRDIVELAKAKGSGWVDYKYVNPETKKVGAKTAYILKADDMILCCGVYK
jgi:signal transduction histidine kinase